MSFWQSFRSALEHYRSDPAPGNEEAVIHAYKLFCDDFGLSESEKDANVAYLKRQLEAERRRRVA